jgi:hypothetical protein
MISKVASMTSVSSMILVWSLLVTLMLVTLMLELLCSHAHLHRVALMVAVSIHYAMLALLVVLAVHAVRDVWRRLRDW